jgi:hypothetical protein
MTGHVCIDAHSARARAVDRAGIQGLPEGQRVWMRVAISVALIE